MSSCVALALWVTKLTLAFYSCPDRVVDLSETPSPLYRAQLLVITGEDGRKEGRRIRITEHLLWPRSYI